MIVYLYREYIDQTKSESLLVVILDILGDISEGLGLVLGQFGLERADEGAVGVGLHNLLADSAADIVA